MNEKAKAKIDIIKLGFKQVNHISISDEDIEKLPFKELERYFEVGMSAIGSEHQNKKSRISLRYGQKMESRNSLSVKVLYALISFYYIVVLSMLVKLFIVTGFLIEILTFGLIGHEVRLIFTDRSSFMDLIMQTTKGKVFFWILLIVAIGLTLYIPQVWGEWTRSGIING